jgi:hypothetical protein
MSADEARRIARNIARLLELLGRGEPTGIVRIVGVGLQLWSTAESKCRGRVIAGALAIFLPKQGLHCRC